MRLLTFFFLLTFSHVLFAGSFSHSWKMENFDKAEKAGDKLWFQIVSTKVGLFSSDVPGYAREFRISGEKDGNRVKNIKLVMDPASFDTDNGSRDEKLRDYCFEVKKFPNLEIKITGPVEIRPGPQTVNGVMNVRGKDKKIQMIMEISSDGNSLASEGEASLSFKELEIPDPSIAVASVDDKIQVEFRVNVPLNNN